MKFKTLTCLLCDEMRSQMGFAENQSGNSDAFSISVQKVQSKWFAKVRHNSNPFFVRYVPIVTIRKPNFHLSRLPERNTDRYMIGSNHRCSHQTF